MNEIKTKFKLCMGFMYPQGVSSKVQKRDLVRTFCMSWLECLLSIGQPEATESILDEYEAMTAPDWYPDESWEWIV